MKSNKDELIQAMNVISTEHLCSQLIDMYFEPLGRSGFRGLVSSMKQRIYFEKTIFFRVRKKDNLDNITHSDFWEPPKEFISMGRVNDKGEQKLYMTDGSIETPLAEVGVENNESFLLIVYQAVKKIYLNEVGFSAIEKDDDDSFKALLDYYFFKKTEGIYALTNLIAKKYVIFPIVMGGVTHQLRLEKVQIFVLIFNLNRR